MPVTLDVTKGSKMRGAQLVGDAATGIGHGYFRELVVGTPAPNRQHSSLRRRVLHRLHRIEREVHDHLLKLNAICVDLGQDGFELRLHLDSLVLRLAGHGLHRLVDSLVEIRFPQFEFGLAQELADARNDVAGAPIVALDVAQDLRHLAQLGRIGA